MNVSVPILSGSEKLNQTGVERVRNYLLFIYVFCSQMVAASTVFPDRLQLLVELQDRQFSELNGILSVYQDNYEQGRGDERLIAYFVETFANADPDSESLIREWISYSPESYIPYLVRAYYYYSIAWSWRGYKPQADTSAEGIQRMYHYLQLAADDLTRAVELKPRLSAAYAMAIRILTMMGSAELKQEAMDEAFEDDSTSYLVHSAFLWSLKPKWGGEIDEVAKFITKTREHAESNELLKYKTGYADYVIAESLQEQGRFEDARVYFDTAIAEGADHVTYRKRGINYYRLKDYEKALNDFDMALQLWPQDSRVLRWRAYTLWQMEKQEEALADLELASVLTPYNKYVLMARASFKRKLGSFDTVLDNYINALFYNERDADIWFAKGMHQYRDLLDFKMAANDLSRAAELAPGKAKYWYEYSAILHYNLDCEIVSSLQHYLALCANGESCNDSEYAWALRARDWLEQSQRCAGKIDNEQHEGTP